MSIGDDGLRRTFFHLGSFAFIGALLYWAQPVFMPLAIAVLALAFLMLLRGEDLRNRVVRLLGIENVVATTRVFDEASRRISRFLLFQLILNLGFGAVVACALVFIGLPYPYLWGALAALL